MVQLNYKDLGRSKKEVTTSFIEFRNITKKRGKEFILKDVNFVLTKGYVTTLLGDIKSGKSLLLDVFMGQTQIDYGSILSKGKYISFGSPKAARKMKFAIVNKFPKVINKLSVLDNVILGQESFINLPRIGMRKKFRELNARFNFGLVESTLVGELTDRQKTFVEIMRALWTDKNIVFFEDTLATTNKYDYLKFLKVIDYLKEQGTAVVVTTDSITLSKEISDYIIVLRNGTTTLTEFNSKSVSNKMLIEAMESEVDSHVFKIPRRTKFQNLLTTVIDVRNVTSYRKGAKALDDVSFEIKKGKIIGLLAIKNEDTEDEIFRVITGLRPLSMDVTDRSQIVVEGDDFTRLYTHERLQRVSYLPTDYWKTTVMPNKSCVMNFLATTSATNLGNYFSFRENADKKYEYNVKRFNINFSKIAPLVEKIAIQNIISGMKTPWIKLKYLSESEIRKFVVARECTKTHRLLLANKPTQGLLQDDRDLVLRTMINFVEKDGGTILMSSHDINELLAVCDEIFVFASGKLTASISPTKTSKKDIEKILSGELSNYRVGAN